MTMTTGFMPTKSISVKKVKGLPKRASQAQHKTRRQACWARGQQRKDARRLDQEQRARENKAIRGKRPRLPFLSVPVVQLTPWELAKWERRQRRAQVRGQAIVIAAPSESKAS